ASRTEIATQAGSRLGSITRFVTVTTSPADERAPEQQQQRRGQRRPQHARVGARQPAEFGPAIGHRLILPVRARVRKAEQAMPKYRLDKVLVERGLCVSRPRAQALILVGEVVVGVFGVTQPGTSADVDAPLRLKGGTSHPSVSRGGLKLRAALDGFPI